MALPPLSPRSKGRIQSNVFFFLVGMSVGAFLAGFVTLALFEHGNSTPERTSPFRLMRAGQLWRNGPHHLISPSLETSASDSLLIQPKSMSDQVITSTEADADGWSSIHVFYGNASLLPESSDITRFKFDHTTWFSQVRQDEVVATLFNSKKNGYFVDLAANDAVHISNTYALETNFGWSGICIEPNPVYWESLAFRQCQVVAAVVGNRTRDTVLFKYPKRAAPRGGIVGPEFENKEPSKHGEDHHKLTVTLEEILNRYHAPPVMDYLSLDVEGAQFYVLETFPFHKFRFNVMTIERSTPKLDNLLESRGYHIIKELKKGRETLWVHNDAVTSLNMSALNIDTEHYKYSEKTQYIYQAIDKT